MTDLLIIFPRLARDGYRETSDATSEYNCIAWAASSTGQWWEPDPYLYFYWPPGVVREYTLQAYAAVYETLGYQGCPTADFEISFEKIALYADAAGFPTHAARQRGNGRWTSKLGQDVDIEHSTLAGLSSQYYGEPVLFMRRRRPLVGFPLVILWRGCALLTNYLHRSAR